MSDRVGPAVAELRLRPPATEVRPHGPGRAAEAGRSRSPLQIKFPAAVRGKPLRGGGDGGGGGMVEERGGDSAAKISKTISTCLSFKVLLKYLSGRPRPSPSCQRRERTMKLSFLRAGQSPGIYDQRPGQSSSGTPGAVSPNTNQTWNLIWPELPVGS